MFSVETSSDTLNRQGISFLKMNANPSSLASNLRQHKEVHIVMQHQQLHPLPSQLPQLPRPHPKKLILPPYSPRSEILTIPKSNATLFHTSSSPSLPALLSNDSSRPSTIAPLRTYLSPRVYCTSPLYSMLRRLARLRERLRITAGSVLMVNTGGDGREGDTTIPVPAVPSFLV